MAQYCRIPPDIKFSDPKQDIRLKPCITGSHVMELRDAFGPVMPDTTGYWVLRSQAGYPDKAVPSLCTCKGIRRISEPNKFRLFRKLWQLHKLREIEAHLFYSLFYFWTHFFNCPSKGTFKTVLLQGLFRITLFC